MFSRFVFKTIGSFRDEIAAIEAIVAKRMNKEIAKDLREEEFIGPQPEIP